MNGLDDDRPSGADDTANDCVCMGDAECKTCHPETDSHWEDNL